MNRIPAILLLLLPACDFDTSGVTPPDVTARGVQVGSEGIIEPSCVAREADNGVPVGGFELSADDIAAELSGERAILVDADLEGVVDLQLTPVGYVTEDETCGESLVFNVTARFDLSDVLMGQPVGFASMGPNGVLQFEATTDVFEAAVPPDFDDNADVDLVYAGTVDTRQLGELVFRGCIEDVCEEQTFGVVRPRSADPI